jgi:hypothetical protein
MRRYRVSSARVLGSESDLFSIFLVDFCPKADRIKFVVVDSFGVGCCICRSLSIDLSSIDDRYVVVFVIELQVPPEGVR